MDKRVRTAIEVLLVIGVFVGVGAWQTRDHLGSSDPAPAFALPSLRDDIPTALPVKGKRTLVYFFAPWCGVCKLSAANLATVRAWTSAEDSDVLAVALDYETRADVQTFVDEHAVGVPVLLGTDAVRDAFRVTAYPTYYVLDAEGRVEHVSVGYSSLVGMVTRLAI